ncbi:ABC transporter permease [Saliterribacillus persicus]|uniref:ABC-2 type transport system permease protein n=1 Tax=Saliterribacillus persicus TaxID=930114 RepID=A0A368X582_9BACI|nr:ABC transporter permease [Saliterribacillus persicus]RCW62975.1 ABC-2 type transport system permease protein [Saliterribacillus persicus]
MQWTTIVKKEMLEDFRNFKWVWVPLVFILIAIMDPLTTYYMPKIMDAVGGMPDGTVFEMPEVSPYTAIMMSLTEMSMFGVLVAVAITMAVIAGERKSGVAELILVKPVGYFTYILAKWTEKVILILASYIIGMLVSWYYINLLFGEITIGEFVPLVLFYALWLIFVTTLTIFYNTLFKTPGIVISVTIATLLGMHIVYRIFQHKLSWFPNSLSSHIGDMLNSGSIPSELWGASLVTILVSVVLLFASRYVFRTKEMAN